MAYGAGDGDEAWWRETVGELDWTGMESGMESGMRGKESERLGMSFLGQDDVDVMGIYGDIWECIILYLAAANSRQQYCTVPEMGILRLELVASTRFFFPFLFHLLYYLYLYFHEITKISDSNIITRPSSQPSRGHATGDLTVYLYLYIQPHV